jgi:hypothetical protein
MGIWFRFLVGIDVISIEFNNHSLIEHVLENVLMESWSGTSQVIQICFNAVSRTINHIKPYPAFAIWDDLWWFSVVFCHILTSHAMCGYFAMARFEAQILDGHSLPRRCQAASVSACPGMRIPTDHPMVGTMQIRNGMLPSGYVKIAIENG